MYLSKKVNRKLECFFFNTNQFQSVINMQKMYTTIEVSGLSDAQSKPDFFISYSIVTIRDVVSEYVS